MTLPTTGCPLRRWANSRSPARIAATFAGLEVEYRGFDVPTRKLLRVSAREAPRSASWLRHREAPIVKQPSAEANHRAMRGKWGAARSHMAQPNLGTHIKFHAWLSSTQPSDVGLGT